MKNSLIQNSAVLSSLNVTKFNDEKKLPEIPKEVLIKHLSIEEVKMYLILLLEQNKIIKYSVFLLMVVFYIHQNGELQEMHQLTLPSIQ